MTNNVSRQSFLGSMAEEEFTEQKIGIIGLCGGGSHIAQQLAHIGFRNILICDYDVVDETNLTRMVGSRPSDADNAELKTTVVQRTIKDINQEIFVETVNSKWQEQAEKFRGCSVIFGCVDSLSARDELERFCRRFLIPYIDIGMDVHSMANGFSISGQVALSLPEQPCLRCMVILRDEELAKEHARYGAAGGRPQVVWPNGVLASTAIGQFMTLILPWNQDQEPELLMEYDGNRHSIRESSRSPYLKKMTCSHYCNVGQLGDPFYQ